MNDQKRVMLAIAICLGIFLVWNYLAPPPPPVKKPAPSTTTQPEVQDEPSSPPEAGPKTAADSPAKSPAATAGAGPAGTSSGTAQMPAEATRQFETDLLIGEYHNRRAELRRLTLKNYNERPPEGDEKAPREPISLVLAQRHGKPYQAAIKWELGKQGVESLPPLAFVEGSVGTHVLAGTTATGLDVRIEMSPRPGVYAIDYKLSVVNQSHEPQTVNAIVEMAMFQQKGEEGGLFSGPGVVFSGICQANSEVERKDLGDLEEGPFVSQPQAAWAALDRQYFVVAAVAGNKTPTRCAISAQDRLITVDYTLGQEEVPANGSWQRSFVLYVGPKVDAQLKGVSPELAAMIDYTIMGIPLGFIARPMVWLLNVFHGWLNSWGLAIMLLTLVVKILLFPFTYKSAVSMRKVQMLKPQLDKIKEQYPDDREKQQQAQWQLYKDSGANPLGGCLPMLLQMPVWFALYRALWTSVDLYQQPFLWLPDLTAKEPGIPFLAFGLGVVFFLQQRLTPMAVDSQQAKIMKWVMPVMFTLFMFALPSGLVLYIFVNSVLSIGQQLAINKTVGPPPAAAGSTATVQKIDQGKKKKAERTAGRSPRRARRAK